MAPQTYHRRWTVYLRGELIGEVLAATQEAACMRAIHKFKIKDEDRSELEVRKAKD
jgi:NhaP-type Na+/H+ and K+/H+ antiporter